MALRALSVSDLRRELARREAGSGRLLKQHKKLAARLAAIDAELAELGVDNLPKRRGRPPGRTPGRSAGRRGPGRPKGSRNKGARRSKGGLTLLQAIIKGVRAGSTVSPADAAVAAKRAGYKSSSPNLAMMCANAMGKSSEFRHAGRGAYVLKGGTAKAAPRARKVRRTRKAKKAGGRKASARAASPVMRDASSTKKKAAATAAAAGAAAAG